MVALVTGRNSPFSFILHVFGEDLKIASALIVSECREHVVQIKGVVVKETSVRDAAPLALYG